MKAYELEVIKAELEEGSYYAYLLETESMLIAVDSGIGAMKDGFAQRLDGRDSEAKPLVVINTHGHWDNISLNGWLKKKYGAVLMASGGDGWMMESFENALDCTFKKHQDLCPLTKEQLEFLAKNIMYPKPPDVKLEGGEVIEDGELRLKVIAVPGHTEGSVCLFDEDARVLFAGDALQGAGRGEKAPIYADGGAYLQSLDIIEALEPETLYMGHGIIEGAENCRAFIEESRRTCEEIDAFISERYCERADSLKVIGEALAAERGWKFDWRLAGTIDAHQTHTLEVKVREPEPEAAPEPEIPVPSFDGEVPPIPDFGDFSFDAPPVPSFGDFSFDASDAAETADVPPIPSFSFDAPDAAEAPAVPAFDGFSFDAPPAPEAPSFADFSFEPPQAPAEPAEPTDAPETPPIPSFRFDN